MQCANNIKQVAIALHSYHEAVGALPAGVYYPPGGNITYNAHTWLESLLPYIEAQGLHDQLDFRKPTNVVPNSTALLEQTISSCLVCPSDATAGLQDDFVAPEYRPGGAGTHTLGESYSPSGGPLQMWESSGSPQSCSVFPPQNTAGDLHFNCNGVSGGYASPFAPGMFTGGPMSYRFSDCKDGTSNTFLLGETLPRYNSHRSYFNGRFPTGTTNLPPNYRLSWIVGTCLITPATSQTDINNWEPYTWGFSSLHPGGVNMAMTDGSVTFINETIDYRTWNLLGDKADGDWFPTEQTRGFP